MSELIRSVAEGTESTDITLVCKDGLHVQTHVSLLATLSKKMGELFAICITFPEAIFVPDLKKESVEELLSLYSKEWEEVEVGLDLRQAAELLGLPLPIMAEKHKEANIPRADQTNEQLPDSKGTKPTIPFVLLQVKREIIDIGQVEIGDVSEEKSGSKKSDFESEEDFGSALEKECTSEQEKKEHILLSHPLQSPRAEVDETLARFEEDETEIKHSENPKSEDDLKIAFPDHIRIKIIEDNENENQKDENRIECEICGTRFRNSEEAGIHIGVVHFIFPDGYLNCQACGEKCGSELDKREHVLLKHRWSILKEYEKKYETINQETNDQHREVFGESEETLAKSPKEMRRRRKRKPSRELQQHSKHLKKSKSEKNVDKGKKKRMCHYGGDCGGCKEPECGECLYCLDKPSRGGANRGRSPV